MHILAEIFPYDSALGVRVAHRASSAQDPQITGLNGVAWQTAMLEKPKFASDFFDGYFGETIAVPSCNFSLSLKQLNRSNINTNRVNWEGAPVTLYHGNAGDPWPWPVTFKGVVRTAPIVGDKIAFGASVTADAFEKEVLFLKYAGTGGVEGPGDLKNKVKPWIFGNAQNVQPVLIDAVNNIYQFSAYGPIQAITTLYERGSPFDASSGNYTDYAALVAANVPNGRWATCLAQGLIKLGWPEFGVITGDIQGDMKGGIYRQRLGEIIRHIGTELGLDDALFHAASFDAMDIWAAALPAGGYVNLNITSEALTLLQFIQGEVLSHNRHANFNRLGQLFVTEIGLSAPELTLHARGEQEPAVTKCDKQDVSPPFSKIEMAGNRSWRVHSADEITTDTTLGNQGITTTRFPSLPPTSPAVGSLYFDSRGVGFRYERGKLRINGEDVLLNGQPIFFPDWIEVRDEGVPQGLVAVTAPPPQTVYLTWDGAYSGNQYPRVLTPDVTRAGVNIRTADDVSYAITTSGDIVATVNNTAADANKGRITVTAGKSGMINLAVTVAGIAHPVLPIPFTISQPPAPNIGSGGTQSDSTLANISSTSFATITQQEAPETVFLVTVTAGQQIRVLGSPLYYELSGENSTPVGLQLRARYHLVGDSAAPTVFPGGVVTGTDAYWIPVDVSGVNGSIAFDQLSGALAAGTYEIDVQGALTVSAGGDFLKIYSGQVIVAKA